MKRYCKNDKPYIYTAFPEERAEEILPVLESVASEGARFWYAPAFDRREKHRLQGAFGVLLFVTVDFAASERFHAMVDAAVAYGQKVLCVYLEDMPATPWSAMQLGSQQALFTKALDEAFIGTLKEAFIFREMAVTAAQKKFQRHRAVTMVAAPVVAATVLFFAVVNPLLIAPAMAANALAKQWGLTKEDLESVTELYIAGDQVFGSIVHAWYSYGDHTQVDYDLEVNGNMETQEPLPAGSLTSEDLSILSYMPNLEYLCICGNQITDITPLLSLKNLRMLDLSANPISSIEGIGALTNLEDIRLTTTDITDASPLWDCAQLHLVMLDSTYITDISGAAQLPHLEHLNIEGTAVQNVSFLDEADNLVRFQANRSRISSIPDFKQTKNIYLDIDTSDVRDFSPLAGIESFDTLRLNHTELQDVLPYIEGTPIQSLLWAGLEIDSLQELSGIQITPGGELNLAGCALSSLDGLAHFEGIHRLDFKYARNLTDLSPILELQSLQYLTISSDMRSLAETQLQGARFEIEYRDD